MVHARFASDLVLGLCLVSSWYVINRSIFVLKIRNLSIWGCGRYGKMAKYGDAILNIIMAINEVKDIPHRCVMLLAVALHA